MGSATRRATLSPVGFSTALLVLGFAFVGTDSLSAAPDAYAAYRKADYETATKVFSEQTSPQFQFGRGAAAFRNGDFEQAIEGFGNALLSDEPGLQENAHYNLGNALVEKAKTQLETPPAMISDLENAVEHYDSALALNPENTAAKFNRDAIQKYLDELKKQQNQDQDDQKQEDQDDEKQENEDQKEESDQEKQDDQQQQEEGDQESEDQQQQDQEGEQGENENEGKQGEQEESSEDDDQQSGSPQNGEEGEEGSGSSDPQPQGGAQEEKPPEGELREANGDKPNEGDQKQEQRRIPAEMRVNPETGFSKSQARALLQRLADIDKSVNLNVDENKRPDPESSYKNW